MGGGLWLRDWMGGDGGNREKPKTYVIYSNTYGVPTPRILTNKIMGLSTEKNILLLSLGLFLPLRTWKLRRAGYSSIFKIE